MSDESTSVLPPPGDELLAEAENAPNKLGRPPLSHIEAPEETDDQRHLRYAAGLHYTTDLRGTTVAQMAKHPTFGAVSTTTLAGWCKRDQWVERRKANLEAWRCQIERGIGNELTRARTEQLRRIREVFDQAIQKLENNVVGAKSWEGVASVLVKLADLIDAWQDKIRTDTVPALSQAFEPPEQARPRLTDEEARAAATVIIQKRRERIRMEAAREKVPPEKVQNDGGEQPELQTVVGVGRS